MAIWCASCPKHIKDPNNCGIFGQSLCLSRHVPSSRLVTAPLGPLLWLIPFSSVSIRYKPDCSMTVPLCVLQVRIWTRDTPHSTVCVKWDDQNYNGPIRVFKHLLSTAYVHSVTQMFQQCSVSVYSYKHMRQSAPLPVQNNAMNVAARVYRCQYLPMSVLQGTASRRDNTAVRTRHQCGWHRLPVKCNIQVA